MRELRGGLRGFYVFIACIALGVMAIAGVGSVAASLGEGLAREGRTLLGGDVAFSLIQREAKPDEVAFLRARGEVSVAATLRAMARTGDGRLALVELKAVDGTYPMLGELTLDPTNAGGGFAGRARRRVRRGGRFDPAGAARSQARRPRHHRQRDLPDPQRGRRRAGQARRRRRPRPALPGQRSRLARDRVAAARQPGALDLSGQTARQRRRRSRRDRADRRCAKRACREAGWEIRSRSNASPQLERTISRFTQFLTLVGLAALLVGGVGVANAVKSHIDRRRDVIAAFKALGATGRDVFTIYLTQVIVLAGIGSVIGLAAGAALPFVIVGVFGKLLPLPVVPALHPDELALSFVYGLLTALAFGLWPLGRVHDVPVAALFREAVDQRMASPALALSRA